MTGLKPNIQILDREGPITIRRMVPSDVGIIATKLSAEDIAELEKLDVSPFEALKSGYEIGSFCGLVDGIPEAAFGINRRVYPAAIWMLMSDVPRRYPRHLMAVSRRWVAYMNRDIAVANIVPATSKRNIAYLEALDFEFEDKVYNVNGNAFRRFHRGPLTTALPH